MTWSAEAAQRAVVIVSVVLLHDMINRRVVISLYLVDHYKVQNNSVIVICIRTINNIYRYR